MYSVVLLIFSGISLFQFLQKHLLKIKSNIYNSAVLKKKFQKRQKSYTLASAMHRVLATSLSWHPVPVCGACSCEQLLLLSAARQLAGGGGSAAAVGAANRATRRATASLLVLSQFRYSADTCHRRKKNQ
jgi:hypothetical protein